MSNLITEYLSTLPEYQRKLLQHPEGRRVLTRNDFRLFCYLYFRDTMKGPDTGGEVTLSKFHEAFIADAIKYTGPAAGPAASRTAWVCPRGSGKSSMMMMLIIWLSAHQHQRFIALFSGSAQQSEDMLSNIRGQFTSNDLLRADFPDLVKPATRRNAEIKLSDNKQLVLQANGTILTGRGVNTSVLGMRIDGQRPSLILTDDIEVGEAQTSKNDVENLLKTLTDDIMPLSLNAHFVWVGTTTRPAGLTEALVHAALGMDHSEWVDDENFRVNYWPALKEDETGQKHSIWPERWSTDFLKSIEHTRSYKKNYACLPASEDYHYWSPSDFQYREAPDLDYTMLSVDPAVTVKESSDYSGLSIVGYSIAERKTYVLHAEQVKMTGADLRQRASQLIEMYPAISLIYSEVNNGGDLVTDIFSPLPVKVKAVSQAVKKEIRAATVLAEYQKGNVFHTRKLSDLESQMVAFPSGRNDDLIDSTGSAILYFAKVNETSGPRVKATQGRYN